MVRNQFQEITDDAFGDAHDDLVFPSMVETVSNRSHAKNSILGLMTKMAALGIFGAGKTQIQRAGTDATSTL